MVMADDDERSKWLGGLGLALTTFFVLCTGPAFALMETGMNTFRDKTMLSVQEYNRELMSVLFDPTEDASASLDRLSLLWREEGAPIEHNLHKVRECRGNEARATRANHTL
jgi:hypothetical protein